MSDPQQPELRRSERGDVTQEGRRVTREADDAGAPGGRSGPVPPENQPGHRPDHDQDKPTGPPGD
ncbi:MAG TPA: hypothetical protein VLA82_04920 [Actinomycetota bacterium]|nr:hypothetical protein [Actinomycetota bacterium]